MAKLTVKSAALTIKSGNLKELQTQYEAQAVEQSQLQFELADKADSLELSKIA